MDQGDLPGRSRRQYPAQTGHRDLTVDHMGNGEQNEEERKELYKELAIKLDEINNNIPVYYSSINVGANKKVEGFVMDANGYHSLEKVKVAQ